MENNICYPISSIEDDLLCEDDDGKAIGYLIPATDGFEQGHAFLAANDPVWENSLSYSETFEEFFGETTMPPVKRHFSS